MRDGRVPELVLMALSSDEEPAWEGELVGLRTVGRIPVQGVCATSSSYRPTL